MSSQQHVGVISLLAGVEHTAILLDPIVFNVDASGCRKQRNVGNSERVRTAPHRAHLRNICLLKGAYLISAILLSAMSQAYSDVAEMQG